MLVQVASTGGIVLDTCKSVTLKGSAILTYQWDQYPYAQGTLLNVTEDQVNLTVQVGLCERMAWLPLHTHITHPVPWYWKLAPCADLLLTHTDTLAPCAGSLMTHTDTLAPCIAVCISLRCEG